MQNLIGVDSYFWNKIDTIRQIVGYNDISKSEIILIRENPSLKDVSVVLDNPKFEGMYVFNGERTIKTEPPFASEYFVKSYNKLKSCKEERKTYDIGIITILPCETSAIRKYMDNVKKGEGKSNRSYFFGTLPGADGKSYKVALTQQLASGNLSASNTYKDLISDFNPRLIVLAGIAGGITPKNRLCDVVFANQIIYYEDKKETQTKVLRRGRTYNTSPRVLRFINDFFIEYGEFAYMAPAENSYDPKGFQISQSPIGSGEAVIANSASEAKLWLQNFNDKTSAVETEAAGVSHAYYEAQLSAQNTIGILIVRGISDHADYNKDDKWRIPASENAAKALRALIELITEL